MGLDRFENEELIKCGFVEYIWFHVDKMSSAHVCLRLQKGQTIDDISEGLLEDCAQVRTMRVQKRINEIVNRLNKTKVERKPDLKAEKEAVNAAEGATIKQQLREEKRYEERQRLEKERQAEMRSYKGLSWSLER